MTRHTAAWWAERVAEIGKTGDPSAVARRHGVKPQTLLWWRAELRKRVRPDQGPRLLPVVLSGSTPPPGAEVTEEFELRVEVGAARISLRGPVTPAQLVAVVTAAARAC